MDDFHNTTHNQSSNCSNTTSFGDGDNKHVFIMHVLTCVISAIGIPLTLLAVFALYSQVRKNHVASIYIINLLMSDLIQLCCMVVQEMQHKDKKSYKVSIYIHEYAVWVSICFMVCISLERYLVIACPLWYRFRRNIKIPVLVCALVWTLNLVPIFIHYFKLDYRVLYSIPFILHLLPLPLLLFFLVGTLRALSASKAVHCDEKRRIVGMLVLVLLIYMTMLIPNGIWIYTSVLNGWSYKTFDSVSFLLLKMSPLADLLMYHFSKKGTIDKLLATLCWCRMDSNDNRRQSVSVSMMTT